jgi:hypothetical protein
MTIDMPAGLPAEGRQANNELPPHPFLLQNLN